MDLLRLSTSQLSTIPFLRTNSSFPTPLRRRFLPVRFSLPFPNQNAKFHKELKAAVDVVEKSCRLCVDVKKSLFSSEGRILEKTDQTPVTIADFGVQALVSLELGKLFPSIPLVAEEDSGFLRSNNLVDSVVSAVSDKVTSGDRLLTNDDVLDAIDRGGKNPVVYGTKLATYWILDPIDGTKGFLKGNEALYVVGLALVVEGEIVLGVMRCPNWQVDAIPFNSSTKVEGDANLPSKSGIVMVAHVGCGTWTRRLSTVTEAWTRCFVDECNLVQEARFCIPESQTWESLPLSALFCATNDADSVTDKEIRILSKCCGSLCKYLMVASGRTSVFIQRVRSQKVIKAWDHAVGVICVHEAGGEVTDWSGSQLDFAVDQIERRIIFPMGGVLVTNGNLHNGILEMIYSSSSIFNTDNDIQS